MRQAKITLNREGLQREIEFQHAQMRKLADICEHQDKQLRQQAKAIKQLSAREDRHYSELATRFNDLYVNYGVLLNKVMPGAHAMFRAIDRLLKVDSRKEQPDDAYHRRPHPKKRPR